MRRVYTKMSRCPHGMSYMFGDSCPEQPSYYTGDGRFGERLSTDITPPPAWVVADWMLMRHRGEPLSAGAVAYCDAPTTNKFLLWLRDYLR